jgi:hypothetical protein
VLNGNMLNGWKSAFSNRAGYWLSWIIKFSMDKTILI